MTWQDRLREYMKGKGQTQAEFAKAIGIHRDVLNRYVNGKQQPSADFFQRLRHAGVSLDWLFTGDGSPDADQDVEPQPDLARLLAELRDLTARYQADVDKSGGKQVESSTDGL